VAAGTSHSCARLVDGEVTCWGSNDHGQLGAPASDVCSVEDTLHGGPPASSPCRDHPLPVSGLPHAAEIAVAGSTSCARLDDGTVRCWGANALGLIGDGTTTDRAAATPVRGLFQVTQIALSDTHACARLDDGTLSCWGGNFFGQLGVAPVAPPKEEIAKSGYAAVKVLAPAAVPGLDQVVEVAVGSDVTCARRKDRSVHCFGKLAPATKAQVAPTEVASLRGAASLALGQGTHCAIFAGGSMQCWGASSLGPMLSSGSATPTPVPATAAAGVHALALGPTRACAVAGAGDVLCWGDDGKGTRAPARRVALSTAAVDVALGASHACAVGKDGSVWCWGDSFYGEAGPRPSAGAPTSAFWTPPQRIVPSP
jgi:alpha-tubulin suppressor-like RCC1 family protein